MTWNLDQKQRMTRVEEKFLRRLAVRGVPLSRHSISPADVRTGRRLEKAGFVTYPDDGCFRLTPEGAFQAKIRGYGPADCVAG